MASWRATSSRAPTPPRAPLACSSASPPLSTSPSCPPTRSSSPRCSRACSAPARRRSTTPSSSSSPPRSASPRRRSTSTTSRTSSSSPSVRRPSPPQSASRPPCRLHSSRARRLRSRRWRSARLSRRRRAPPTPKRRCSSPRGAHSLHSSRCWPTSPSELAAAANDARDTCSHISPTGVTSRWQDDATWPTLATMAHVAPWVRVGVRARGALRVMRVEWAAKESTAVSERFGGREMAAGRL
mmetsp:Transcript_59068/g.162002  ORF Transcript_59068/g.162002 Transcript_59068/m.162002 type:complete len:241 (-) Transcript_59068:176-898(-)